MSCSCWLLHPIIENSVKPSPTLPQEVFFNATCVYVISVLFLIEEGRRVSQAFMASTPVIGFLFTHSICALEKSHSLSTSVLSYSRRLSLLPTHTQILKYCRRVKCQKSLLSVSLLYIWRPPPPTHTHLCVCECLDMCGCTCVLKYLQASREQVCQQGFQRLYINLQRLVGHEGEIEAATIKLGFSYTNFSISQM